MCNSLCNVSHKIKKKNLLKQNLRSIIVNQSKALNIYPLSRFCYFKHFHTFKILGGGCHKFLHDFEGKYMEYICSHKLSSRKKMSHHNTWNAEKMTHWSKGYRRILIKHEDSISVYNHVKHHSKILKSNFHFWDSCKLLKYKSNSCVYTFTRFDTKWWITRIYVHVKKRNLH